MTRPDTKPERVHCMTGVEFKEAIKRAIILLFASGFVVFRFVPATHLPLPSDVHRLVTIDGSLKRRRAPEIRRRHGCNRPRTPRRHRDPQDLLFTRPSRARRSKASSLSLPLSTQRRV
jgi:hypothetical protein